MSGYVDCGCRDCFDVAIGKPGDLCGECEEAGCFGEDAHCQREDALDDAWTYGPGESAETDAADYWRDVERERDDSDEREGRDE